MRNKNQEHELDELDKRILLHIIDRPGKSIKDSVKPFIDHRSYVALKARVIRMANSGLIRIRQAKRGNVLVCNVTPKGQKAVGHAGAQPPEEADSDAN